MKCSASVLTILLIAAGGVVANAQQQSLDAQVESNLAAWVATYKMLHAAPELSHREEKTAAFVAKELRSFGYEVTERIGKSEGPQWNGYGVAAVMKNGS